MKILTNKNKPFKEIVTCSGFGTHDKEACGEDLEIDQNDLKYYSEPNNMFYVICINCGTRTKINNIPYLIEKIVKHKAEQ
ncbi:MAG: hypothetical protein KDC47_07365 [Flavobacteriaceae bacterium]|nr:hypothetical protein [Flavobacteriaceae bacterium]